MLARIAACCILPLLVTSAVHAEVRFESSRNWKRAKLIGPGRQVWSFQTSYKDIHNDSSSAQTVTWRQVLEAESSVQARAILNDQMRSSGLNPNDVAATAQYRIDRQEVNFGLNWAYGMTSRWMIGFQVPFVLRQTQTNRRVILTPSLVNAEAQLNRNSILTARRKGLQESVASLAEKHLTASGYDDVSDHENFWSVGDISLLNQFSLLRNYRWGLSLQQEIRIPTSRKPDARNYLRTASDEGNIDLGLTTMADYQINNWLFGMKVGFIAQLPDRATPVSEQKDIRRDLGDWAWGTLDSEYHLNKNWDLSFQYSYFNKSSDRYQGLSVAANSEQELQETRLGLLYSFAETAARRGIDHKWVAALGYTYPLVGRNNMDVSQTSIELTSYF